MPTPSPGDVRAKAEELLKAATAKAATDKTQSDADHIAAASLPNFSKSTVALDDDGKPVVAQQTLAPASEEVHPEGARLNADAMANAIAEAEGRTLPERNAAGQFVKEEGSPDGGQAPPEPDAAEIAAQQVLKDKEQQAQTSAPQQAAVTPDDYEDVAYTDDDTGETFTVRAPKAVAARVKQGYVRRSMMHRNATFMGEARPVLEPLIQSGQLREILPLIQRAMQDPEYAQFVVEAYNRRVSGMPLTPQQQQAADVAQAAAAVTQQETPPNLGLEDDPFMAQYLSPIERRLAEIDARTQAFETQQQQQREYEQQQRAQQQQSAQVVGMAHNELVRNYPQEWTGDVAKDDQLIRRTIKYAHDSGLIQAYGATVPTLLLAYGQLRAERAAAVESPAALATVERDAARSVAADAARSVTGGAPTTTATPPRKAVPALPPTRDPKTGRPTDIKDFAAAAIARIGAQ